MSSTREIKFRTWYEPHSMAYDEPNFRKPDSEHDAKTHVMQFTGIQDKNGKDIYEGDILKFTDGSKHEVAFMKGTFGISNSFIVGITPFIDLSVEEFEVVGNVWENPEMCFNGK